MPRWSITVLLLHMPAVIRMSGLAAQTMLSGADLGAPRIQLVLHAGGGLLVLLAATTLSVYKPWGRTWYGRRRQDDTGVGTDRGSTTGMHWGLYVGLGILVLLLVALHLLGGGLGPAHRH